jgi:hypothetical protein
MATKKKALAKLPPKQQESKLPVIANWRERLQKNAGEALQKGIGGESGGSITFDAGRFSYKDQILGDRLDCVIVGVQAARAYYAGAYKTGAKDSPTCYSYDGEAPHPDSADKQNPDCASCHWNQFRTAQQGEGKGCREGYRIAVVDVKAIEDGRAATAEALTMKFSITASKVIAKHVKRLTALHGSIVGAVSTLLIAPDRKTQYTIEASIGDELSDATQEILGSRIDDVEALLNRPYPKPEAGKSSAPTGGRTGKIARRKI